MIQLKEVDHNNWIQCIELEVTEEQKQFVNPNIFSLAEAYVHSGEKKDAEECYRCKDILNNVPVVLKETVRMIMESSIYSA